MRGHPPEHEIDIWGECMEDGCDYGAEDAYWNKVDAGLIDAEADAAAYHLRRPASGGDTDTTEVPGE